MKLSADILKLQGVLKIEDTNCKFKLLHMHDRHS